MAIARILFVFVAIAGATMTIIAAINALIVFIVFGVVLVALGLVGIFYFARPKQMP